MHYKNSLGQVARALKEHTGIIIQHKTAGPLRVTKVRHEPEGWWIDTIQADKKTGEFNKVSAWQLWTIYEKMGIVPDGDIFASSEDEAETAPTSTQATSFLKMSGQTTNGLIPDPTFAKKASTPKISGSKGIRYSSFEELFKAMDSADSMNGAYSKHFWHLTEMRNAVEILKSGFLSRAKLKRNIPFDGIKNIPDEASVMSNNKTQGITEWCRFYLRPRNDFFCSWLHGGEADGSFIPVCFSISRSRLFENTKKRILEQPVLMIPFGGYSAVRTDLHWSRQINSLRKLREFDFSQFFWTQIYMYYYPSLLKEIKRRQRAELLVYGSLPSDYIDGIYFRNEAEKCTFLAHLDKKEMEVFGTIIKVLPDIFFKG